MFDPNMYDWQLSIEEYKRYSRHLVLEEVGATGQSRLKASKVLIVGLGGLGSLASMYLVAAGVGHIGIVDYDSISLSNLQRQILYDTSVISEKKVSVAKLRLNAINPTCKIVTFDTKLISQNASKILLDYDLIVDASDNFFTRYLLNDTAVASNIPIVYGAILKQEGQISVFNYRGGPTYRDLFYEKPHEKITLSCSEGGILGGVAAVISSLQVNEVMKIILGLGNVISGKLLIYNFSTSFFKTVSLNKKVMYSHNFLKTSLRELQIEELGSLLHKTRVDSIGIVSSEIMLHINNDKCLLIDVRTQPEYQIMHLTNAQNIPLALLRNHDCLEFFTSKISEGFYVLIYCSFDSRSITAVNILAEFKIHSFRLLGGLKALGF